MAGKTGFLLCLRSRDGRAGLADRGAARAEERDAGRTDVAHAAVPDSSAAVQQTDVHRGRHQSARVVGQRTASTFKQRLAKARNDRPLHSDQLHDTVHIPGNNGGAVGAHRRRSGDRQMYVISQTTRRILRLLKPGEGRPAGRRACGVSAGMSGLPRTGPRAVRERSLAAVDVPGRLDTEAIRLDSIDGKGRMPAFSTTDVVDMERWPPFSSHRRRWARRRGSGATCLRRPVVGRAARRPARRR